mgnify:CR=1 FL=1
MEDEVRYDVASEELRLFGILKHIKTLLQERDLAVRSFEHKLVVDNFANVTMDTHGIKMLLGTLTIQFTEWHDHIQVTDNLGSLHMELQIPPDVRVGLPPHPAQITPSEYAHYLSPEDRDVSDKIVAVVVRACGDHNDPWFVELSNFLTKHGYENTIKPEEQCIVFAANEMRLGKKLFSHAQVKWSLGLRMRMLTQCQSATLKNRMTEYEAKFDFDGRLFYNVLRAYQCCVRAEVREIDAGY